MDGLSRTYEALLAGTYDCLDRIVVNAYFRMGHDAGGFRVWWRKLTGSEDTLDNAHRMRMAGRFSRRLRAWAAEQGIPVRDCRRGEAKHEIGEEVLRNTTVRGRLVSDLGQPSAGAGLGCSSESPHHSQEARCLCKPLLVSHPGPRLGSRYHQGEWAPAFSRSRILNGHEYMDRQARRAGIFFTREGNCFSHISDLTGFARIAETLTDESATGRIAAVCRRWIYSTCLECALDAQQRQQSGFHYEYSVYQFEYNRDLIFHQGCEMSAVLEALVDRNRVRMNVPHGRSSWRS